MSHTNKEHIPGGYRAYRQLSEGAIRLLNMRCSATVGSLSKDGSIHMAPVWFLFHSDRVYFETNSATGKARNIAAQSTASVLVKGKGRDRITITVLATGTARILRGDEADGIKERLRAKYLTDRGRLILSHYLDGIDDVAVEVVPAKWLTWTGAVIDQDIRTMLELNDGSWDDCFRPDDD